MVRKTSLGSLLIALCGAILSACGAQAPPQMAQSVVRVPSPVSQKTTEAPPLARRTAEHGLVLASGCWVATPASDDRAGYPLEPTAELARGDTPQLVSTSQEEWMAYQKAVVAAENAQGAKFDGPIVSCSRISDKVIFLAEQCFAVDPQSLDRKVVHEVVTHLHGVVAHPDLYTPAAWESLRADLLEAAGRAGLGKDLSGPLLVCRPFQKFP